MTNLNNELSIDELEAVSGGADALNIDLGLVKIKAVFDGGCNAYGVQFSGESKITFGGSCPGR